MSAACSGMTAAPSVIVIVLTGLGVRAMTHEDSRPGGPSWSPARRSLPCREAAPRGLLGGGGKGARWARGCCGVRAAGPALPCPALPAFVWPRRGPAPAQVRPRRPEPRPRRGGARPGPPAVPARGSRPLPPGAGPELSG